MDTVSKHTIKLGLNTTECHLASLSHGRREKRKELEKEKSLLGRGGDKMIRTRCVQGTAWGDSDVCIYGTLTSVYILQEQYMCIHIIIYFRVHAKRG